MIELTGMESLKMLQELGMKVNGRWTNSMVEAKRFLRKKDQFTKESSLKAKSMGKEFSNGLMEATTREILYKENMRAEVFTILLTKDDSMKESSLTIKCMGMGKKLGLTVGSIKETTETQRKMVLGHLYGLTATCIKGTGVMTNKTEKESTSMYENRPNEEANGKKANESNGQEM